MKPVYFCSECLTEAPITADNSILPSLAVLWLIECFSILLNFSLYLNFFASKSPTNGNIQTVKKYLLTIQNYTNK